MILIPFSVIASSPKKLIMGSFDYYPVIYKDKKDNTVKGLFIDIIEEIAKKENWKITYKHGTFAEQLEGIKDGSLDLITGVVFTKERNVYLDFNNEPVVISWTQVFANKSSNITDLLTVRNKKIGIMQDDNNGKIFEEHSKTLGINCEILVFSDLDTLLNTLNDGYIDAGVFNSMASMGLNSKYENIEKTSINLNPVGSFYAVPQGDMLHLLPSIDKYLKMWKDDESSVYHEKLHYWLHRDLHIRNVVPRYILYGMLSTIFCFVTSILITVGLKRMIANKTKELKDSEDRFKALHNASFGGIAIHDKGIILDCNQGLVEITGFSFEELIGMNGLQLIAENSRAAVRSNIETKYELPYNSQGLRKNGDEYPVRLEGKNIPYKGMDVRVTEFRDITELYRTELALKEKEQFLRETNSLAKVGGWTLDNNEALTFTWHEHLYDIFELPYGIKITMDYVKTNFHHKKDYILVDELMHNIFEHKEGGEVRCEIITHKKNKKWVHIIGVPNIVDGKVTQILGAVQDISELKKEQSDKEQMQIQLHQAQKMESLGTLSGGIAHDFNNILAGIVGYTELISMTTAPEKLAIYTKRILIGAERAVNLVKQILLFSTKTKFKTIPLKLYISLNEVINLLKSTIPKSISLDIYIDSNAYILADPTQIHQVILNLCTNAIYSMNEISGTLKIRLYNKGENICLEISDTGVGIPEKILPKVFDPYFTTKPKGKGTGLGLSVVHGIITNYGGSIDVISTVGEGTTFKIILPITKKASISPMSKKISNNLEGLETIMIVDDEQSIREILNTYLKQYGYTVHLFKDGLKALHAFKREPLLYDIVVTDVSMPVLDGIEMVKEILEINPNVPIIVSTGNIELKLENGYKKLGISKCLAKPVSLSYLLKEIRNTLDSRVLKSL